MFGVDPPQHDVTAGRGRRDGKRLGLQPVAEHAMVGTAQAVDALDLDPPIRAALDPRAHGEKHGDEVIDLRLEGGVLDHGRTASEGGGEQRVLGAHD